VWCTLIASKLLDAGLNLHRDGYHTLQALVARTFGLALPKDA
jgi:hypothetical protein